jgi:hypothetical protein
LSDINGVQIDALVRTQRLIDFANGAVCVCLCVCVCVCVFICVIGTGGVHCDALVPTDNIANAAIDIGIAIGIIANTNAVGADTVGGGGGGIGD